MEAFCRVSSNPNDYRKLEIILVGRALGTHQHSEHAHQYVHANISTVHTHISCVHAHQYVRKHISTWMQTAPCTSATGTSVSCTLTLTLSTLHTYIYTVPINTVHSYAHQQSTAHTNLSRAAGSLMGNTVVPTINNTPECRFKWLKWIWCKTSSAIMWKILLLLYLPRAHEASFTVRKLEPW